MCDEIVDKYYSLFGNDVHLGIQQCRDEVEELIEYFDGEKFDSYAEVGVDECGSLWLFSHLFLNEGAKIYAIDQSMKKIAFKVMNELDKYFDVTVVHGDSLGDYFRRVELTFIDGGMKLKN